MGFCGRAQRRLSRDGVRVYDYLWEDMMIVGSDGDNELEQIQWPLSKREGDHGAIAILVAIEVTFLP